MKGIRIQSKKDGLGLWSTSYSPNSIDFYDIRETIGRSIEPSPPDFREKGKHYFTKEFFPNVKSIINNSENLKFHEVIEKLAEWNFEVIEKEVPESLVLWTDGEQFIEKML